MSIPDRLDKNVILEKMSPLARETFTSLDVSQSLDSTNNQIRSFMPGSVLLAEEQTKGKGRRGKQWESPFAEGIYMSILLSRDRFSKDLDGLSLAVGVMASRFFTALSEQDSIQSMKNMELAKLERSAIADRRGMTARAGVKWPNDLFVMIDSSVNPLNKEANQNANKKDNRQVHSKLGGILTEIDDNLIIIGIGINYYSNEKPQNIDNNSPYQRTCLSEIFGSATPPRSDACGILLNHLAQGLSQFFCDGFAPFQQEWNNINILHGRKVTIKQGNTTKQGICDGVDEHGNLILLNGKKVTKLASGSVVMWD